MANVLEENLLITLCMLLYMSLGAAAICVLDTSAEDNPEMSQVELELMALGLRTIRKVNRKRQRLMERSMEPPKKKAKYDYERAIMCIRQDYLGDDPLFGKYFERVFRVTRSVAEELITICCNTHSFFVQSVNKVTGDKGIYPESKILMALKILAFGVSPRAFMDYFQMSDQSGRKCLKLFCYVIANHPDLKAKYLRRMSKSDAMRVSAMHYQEFGVRGCLGAIDCMHVIWKNCPTAWQGQYEGKEGSSTIILEAVADYSTWIWHNRFGFPGTMNDVNVWDQSSLLRAFVDGTFTKLIDFPFRIGNKTFNRLWVLADGIYPELSRFVKTISVPLSKLHRQYSAWQEACRKAVERAFGIMQRKFQILTRPIELFHEDDIRNVVNTCIILHNMMVEVRLRRDQAEDSAWYQEREDDGEDFEVPLLLSNVPVPLPKPRTIQEKIETVRSQWPDTITDADKKWSLKEVISEHMNETKEAFNALYDRKSHFELRDAIIERLFLSAPKV
jgi:Plant transposon protein